MERDNEGRRYNRVLQEIFAHPFPHNLEWPDIVSLMGHLGSVHERHDGKYEFRIGSASAVFTKPHRKNVEPEGITELRHFLTAAGIAAEHQTSIPQRTVVLIDHHGARFFENEPASAGLHESDHIEPYDPHGFERHLEHRKEADYQGQRTPEAREFYERVAQRLRNASSIVLIGDATGKSSAMTYLVEYLKEKHGDIVQHIVTTSRADLSHLSLGDIEKATAAAVTSGKCLP